METTESKSHGDVSSWLTSYHHEAERISYYRAALSALRFAEARTPTNRRFGREADALWSFFQGDLKTADRIDILIRDADVQWPGSIGARNVFCLRNVDKRESFGPEWISLDPVDAEELWREELRRQPAHSVDLAIEAIARAWDIKLTPHMNLDVGKAEKLLVIGPSAIASCIRVFACTKDLDWSDQVVCVATLAAHRQLAALAGIFLSTTKASMILSMAVPEDASVAHKVSPRRRIVLSKDALHQDFCWALHAISNR